jgi:RND family efflux transporter MFP subunit
MKAWAVALAAPVAGLGLGGVLLLAGASAPREVPTATVGREPFALAVEAEGFLVPVRRLPVDVPAQVQPPARLAWLAPDGAAVAAGEVVIRLDPTDLERGRTEAADELAKAALAAEAREAKSGSALEQLDRDAEAARLAAEVGRRFGSQDPELYSRREILESDLDSTLADRRVEHAESARAIEARRTRLEADLARIERRRHELRLERAETGLSAIEIRAPFDGIFVLGRNWRGELPRVGDPVWPCQKLAEIPDLSQMAAEVYVLEADAGSLAAGRPATVSIEAHPGERFEARIERVGPLAQRRLRSSPVQYFAVTLALRATDPTLMRPGQRVRAVLDLARADDALVVPRQALFERDGATVAFRREGKGFRAVRVALGASGAGRAVVTDGLAAGDEVALVDPEQRSRRPREPRGGPGVGGSAADGLP